MQIRTDNPYVDAPTKASLFWGIYESAERRLVKKYMFADIDVVELGCSIGVVSILLLKRMARNRRFIGVEAHPFLMPTLRDNLQSNFGERDIRLDDRAIDYNDNGLNVVEFYVSRSFASSTAPMRSPEVRETVTVRTVTLGTLLAEHDLSTYALIMDIEGAEAGLFLAEKQCLNSCQLLIVELHDTKLAGEDITVRQMVDLLTSMHGFQLKERDGNVFAFLRG